MGGRMQVEVVMLVMLALTWLSMPSSAQSLNVGPCWPKVDACVQKNINQSTTNPEFDLRSPSFNRSKLLCCPLIRQTAMADKPCFCSIGPVLHQTPKGAELTKNLIFCNAFDSLASFDAACSGSNSTRKPPSISPQGLPPSPTKATRISPPGLTSNRTRSPRGSPPGLTASPPIKSPRASAPSLAPTPSPIEAPAMSPRGRKDGGSCWDKIGSCLNKHMAERTSKPEFNNASPKFNMTKFLCCSLIQQAAQTDKPCFCTIDAQIHKNPSNETAAMLGILNACNVADSLASFDSLCSGFTPTSTASPPTIPPPGLAPAPHPAETPFLSPLGTTPIKKTTSAEPPKNVSTKISMMGSFSGIFILLTYFLFY